MSNPVLSEKRWSDLTDREATSGSNAMTVNGTVMKTGVLLLVLLLTMGWMFEMFWNNGRPVRAQVMPWMIGGMIGSVAIAVVMMFVKRLAMILGLAYAAVEGLFLGGFTMFMQAQYPGLPLLAAGFTTGTLLAMLILYRTGIIKASSGFIKGVMAAVGGLFLGIGILFVLNLFGIGTGISGALYGGGPIGIGFSLVCIGLAALCLVVDFAVIEQGARDGAPKYMEWVGAFGLMVTLVWLYIEILNLLAKLKASDD